MLHDGWVRFPLRGCADIRLGALLRNNAVEGYFPGHVIALFMPGATQRFLWIGREQLNKVGGAAALGAGRGLKTQPPLQNRYVINKP